MLPILLDACFADRNPPPPMWWEHSHGEVHGSPSRKNTSIAVTRKRDARSLSEIKTPDLTSASPAGPAGSPSRKNIDRRDPKAPRAISIRDPDLAAGCFVR